MRADSETLRQLSAVSRRPHQIAFSVASNATPTTSGIHEGRARIVFVQTRFLEQRAEVEASTTSSRPTYIVLLELITEFATLCIFLVQGEQWPVHLASHRLSTNTRGEEIE